jgi:8-oxo-dGTP pyrophosphatase MutT (NUDIX family)/phosphohistidine phosphatase SixA
MTEARDRAADAAAAGLPSPARAAGGVVWRARGASSPATIAMVHRPGYDDWSLPKGKLEPGEDSMQTAAREIREETGARTALQMRLGSAAYHTDRGPKLVEYFVLRYLDGHFAPTDEVDEVRWLEPAAAGSLASYDADRALIETYADLPRVTATVVLVRHARAGKRSDWPGPDAARPLSPRGQAQARRLALLLEPLQPQRILAAPPVRCIATAAPLAAHLGLEIEVVPWAGDESFGDNPDLSLEGLAASARSGGCSVVCSQGDAIPGLLNRIAGPTSDYATSKGAFWVLSFAGDALVSIDRHGAPAS